MGETQLQYPARPLALVIEAARRCVNRDPSLSDRAVGGSVAREIYTVRSPAIRRQRLDVLFEQIPAYLEFFGFPSTTPDHLRQLVRQDSTTTETR
jgi:hypothetical protein